MVITGQYTAAVQLACLVQGRACWVMGLIGVKRQKRLIDVMTLYCQPGQRLSKFFLSFNTNQKPCIKSPKSGTKIIQGVYQTLLASCPNIKEKQSGYARLG